MQQQQKFFELCKESKSSQAPSFFEDREELFRAKKSGGKTLRTLAI